MKKELENMVHVKRPEMFKIFKNKKYLLTAQDISYQTLTVFRGFLPQSGKQTQELETEPGPSIQIHSGFSLCIGKMIYNWNTFSVVC